MKKLVFLLALIFAVSTLGFAFAEEEPEVFVSGDFAYVLLEDGTAMITGYSGDAQVLELPAAVDGHAVSAIGEGAFYYSFSLCEITIPESVVSVGINPFEGCEKLTNFRVSPDHPALEVIDGALFDKAEKKLICYPCAFTAESYALPQGMLAIGDHAFWGCNSLKSLTIPDGATTIGNMAFASCDSLEEIIIPESVSSIGNSAFSGCAALREVNIPEGLTSIGDSAFFYCESLSEIIIPDSVTSIGNMAFEHCASLAEITIPNSVVSMGFNPFTGCANLTKIIVSPDHPVLAVTDGVLFNKAEKKLICYPYAFAEESYAIPADTLAIGEYAFWAANALRTVDIPESVTSIGEWAFSDCNSLSEIHIPGSVTSIGEEAFSICDVLAEVSISEGVVSIGDWAFSACKSLSQVSLPGSLNSIGEAVFSYCAEDLTLTVAPDSFAEEYANENDIPCAHPAAGSDQV